MAENTVGQVGWACVPHVEIQTLGLTNVFNDGLAAQRADNSQVF